MKRFNLLLLVLLMVSFGQGAVFAAETASQKVSDEDMETTGSVSGGDTVESRDSDSRFGAGVNQSQRDDTTTEGLPINTQVAPKSTQGKTKEPTSGSKAEPTTKEQNGHSAQPRASEEPPSGTERYFSTRIQPLGSTLARQKGERLVPDEQVPALKQFGYDFFRAAPAGFLPETQQPVGPDYPVGPGDTLVINLWGSINATSEVTVDRNGDIILPKVGTIHVWGQSFAQVRETVRQQIARYYTNFELSVGMAGLRSVQVYVVGEVNQPGTYTVSSLSTVLNVLGAAGGPAKTGSLRNIQLVRAGNVVTEVDYYDFFLKGDRGKDLRIQGGDTIFVPVAGPMVGISGDVRRSAIYELRKGETLGQLLAMAGGLNSTAFLRKVRVERVEAHRQRLVLDLDLSLRAGSEDLPAFPLQDRDLVEIVPISSVADRYVMLSGYVAHPGRYQHTEGLRLIDLLLPYDNLLPLYYPKTAEILRVQPPLYRPEKLTVDLGQALTGSSEHNLLLLPFDEVRLFSRDEMEEQDSVSVNGAVLRPDLYRLFAGMTVKDAIVAAGNLRRSAYLDEAEIMRFHPSGRETRSERILFDLAKAMSGDPMHNLPLQVDDQIFIRAIPDYAERLSVELKGEVLFPGIYAIAKGERLSSVLERAGGYTSKAYLRGAFFTRNSLKEVQRANLEKLIFEQEQEIHRASVHMASTALSDEEIKAAESLLVSRKAMVEKLRQAPVTGRMVVRLTALDTLRGSADDVELVSGDEINIPENPQSVSVLGQVYNPTSLIYYPGRSVAYYLDKVGGPKREADSDAIFIVRADGTVVSKEHSGFGIGWDRDNYRWIFGGFNVVDLYPGDTVLVPEKIEKTAWMREIKDISTIFYQMALGAAAVASF